MICFYFSTPISLKNFTFIYLDKAVNVKVPNVANTSADSHSNQDNQVRIKDVIQLKIVQTIVLKFLSCRNVIFIFYKLKFFGGVFYTIFQTIKMNWSCNVFGCIFCQITIFSSFACCSLMRAITRNRINMESQHYKYNSYKKVYIIIKVFC